MSMKPVLFLSSLALVACSGSQGSGGGSAGGGTSSAGGGTASDGGGSAAAGGGASSSGGGAASSGGGTASNGGGAASSGGGSGAAGGGSASVGGGSAGGGSAGGGAMPPPTPWVSGTRLKARVLRDSVGNEELHSWRDTQRNEDCSFQPAGDGQLRCVPWPPQLYHSEGNFSDPSCTMPVTVEYNTTCPTTPKVSVLYVTGGCEIALRFFPVQQNLGMAPFYWRSSNGTCTKANIGNSYTLWSVGPEIPPSAFARATLVAPAQTSGIGQVMVITDDGARAPYRLKDLAGGFDCNSDFAASPKCAPSVFATDGYRFGDASCTQRLYQTNIGCSPRFVADYTVSGCTGGYSYRAAGSAVANIYTQSGTTCSATTPGATTKYLTAGSPVSLATGQTASSPAGRLTHRTVTWPGGLETSAGWTDSQNGNVGCATYYAAGDGSRRCIPAGEGTISGYYADAACTQKLAAVTNGCSPTRLNEYESCVSRMRVFAAGTTFSGQAYTKSGTTCVASTVAANFTLYRVGAEIPPSAMAPLTEVLK